MYVYHFSKKKKKFHNACIYPEKRKKPSKGWISLLILFSQQLPQIFISTDDLHPPQHNSNRRPLSIHPISQRHFYTKKNWSSQRCRSGWDDSRSCCASDSCNFCFSWNGGSDGWCGDWRRLKSNVSKGIVAIDGPFDQKSSFYGFICRIGRS